MKRPSDSDHSGIVGIVVELESALELHSVQVIKGLRMAIDQGKVDYNDLGAVTAFINGFMKTLGYSKNDNIPPEERAAMDEIGASLAVNLALNLPPKIERV